MTKKRAYDATDERQIGQKRNQKNTAQEQMTADVKAVLDTRAGRRFLWRLLERCNPMGSSTGRQFDLGWMSMREGERGIGRWVWGQIERSDPEALVEMVAGGAKETASKDRVADALAQQETQDA